MSLKDKDNYIAFTKALVQQYSELWALLDSGLKMEIPQATGIELQHMLAHLVAASKKDNRNFEVRTQELGNALAHLDRAYQDAAKVLVDNHFPEHQGNVSFMREWLAARLLEGRKHYRDLFPVLETQNSCCRRFRALLTGAGLMADPGSGVGALVLKSTARALNSWESITADVELWLQLDLLYNSLRGRKHLEALQVMLLSFTEVDRPRLQQLNLQLKLEILGVAGSLSEEHGWKQFSSLGPDQRAFIRKHALMSPWQEENVTAHERWICPLFDALWQFYLRGKPPAAST